MRAGREVEEGDGGGVVADAAEAAERKLEDLTYGGEDDEVVRDDGDGVVLVAGADGFDGAPRALLHLGQRLAAGHARIAALAGHPMLR